MQPGSRSSTCSSCFFILPESLSAERRAQVKAEPAKGWGLSELGTTLSLPRVGPLLWIRIVVGFTFAVFEGGFSLWAANSLGLTAAQNGLVLGYVGVLSVITQLGLIGPLTRTLQRRLADRRGEHAVRRRARPVGLTPDIWVLIAIMPLLSLGLAVTNTILGSALTKAVYPDEVGGIVGLSTAIGSLTRIPAPFVAGALLQSVGGWAPGIAAGLLDRLGDSVRLRAPDQATGRTTAPARSSGGSGSCRSGCSGDDQPRLVPRRPRAASRHGR